MASNRNYDREVTFEITESIGVIASYSTGWKKELNLVKWNDGAPKYDIRDWDPGHEHMSRGITLHEKEMQLIVDYIQNRNQQQKRNAAVQNGSQEDLQGEQQAEQQPSTREQDQTPF